MSTTNLSDEIVSAIRVGVAAAVGIAITFAASRGLSIDPATQGTVIATVTPLVIVGYRAAVVRLQKRWPWVGWLLGIKVESATYVRAKRRR